MPLEFNGKSIPGSTGQIAYGSPEQQLYRVKFYGLQGEVEIFGEAGGRSVFIPHILHNRFTAYRDLIRARDNLDNLCGQNGRLFYSSGSGSALQQTSFSDTTLERWEMLAMPGQDSPGPLQDIAGTLFNDSGIGDGGWFLPVVLHFRQLVK
jgi:hypothetical protein